MKKIKKEEQEKVQQLYFEMQLIDQQMNQLQKQVALLDEKLREISIAIEGINEIKNAELGKELLVPITAGIFAKTSLKENKEFIVNVGAGVAVTKSADGAKKLLESQMLELVNYREQILNNTQILEKRAKEIEKEVAGM